MRNGRGGGGGAVGCGTALVAGGSRGRLPMGRIVALGFTQPLTEMSTRNISWEGGG
jgi:hypothetical protein